MNRHPFDAEAEEAVLGSALINPACLPRLSALRPDHFFIVKNGWAWQAMLHLRAEGIAVDFLTVRSELERDGRLSEAGGPAWLTSLMNAVPTALHAEAYARVVLEASRRRRLIEAASGLARLAYEANGSLRGDAYATLAQMRDLLGEDLAEAEGSAQAVASRVYETLKDPSALRARLVPWGLPALDKAMGGGQERGALALFGARPSMGKSAALCQAADEAAHAGLRVLVVTQEHTADQWLRRMAFSHARADWLAFKQGRISPEDHERVLAATLEIGAYPTLYIDGARQTTEAMRAQALQLADRWGGLDLMITDHLSLFQDTAEREVLRLGLIAGNHKQLAREADCAVLAACQLSRSVEHRADKRPILSDLRESGEIEQHADDVWMLYRDAYYNPASPAGNTIEFWPRKARDGSTDVPCRMAFVKEITRLESLTKEEPDERYDYLHK